MTYLTKGEVEALLLVSLLPAGILALYVLIVLGVNLNLVTFVMAWGAFFIGIYAPAYYLCDWLAGKIRHNVSK